MDGYTVFNFSGFLCNDKTSLQTTSKWNKWYTPSGTLNLFLFTNFQKGKEKQRMNWRADVTQVSMNGVFPEQATWLSAAWFLKIYLNLVRILQTKCRAATCSATNPSYKQINTSLQVDSYEIMQKWNETKVVIKNKQKPDGKKQNKKLNSWGILATRNDITGVQGHWTSHPRSEHVQWG